MQFLRVKAETIFKLHAPHPVHLTTLPNFLKDSNLEFFTSSFISSHKDEYPHSLDVTLLETRNFNAGKPLKVKGRLYVYSTVDQEVSGVVDTGNGWIFNRSVTLKPGARLSALKGSCSAQDITVDRAKVFASDLTVQNAVNVDEGYLYVQGKLKACAVSNVYRGNMAQPSTIIVTGNTTVTQSFRNEWINPGDSWHGNETTFVQIDGTLTVGAAGGRSATLLNKCGRVYVNGRIKFNGQKFENLVAFKEHKGLTLYIHINDHARHDFTQIENLSLKYFTLSAYLIHIKISNVIKELIKLNALSTSTIETVPNTDQCIIKYIHNPGEIAVDLRKARRVVVKTVFRDRPSRLGLDASTLDCTIDYDEPIHKEHTSVIGRGGIIVNGVPVTDNSTNTSSFVNQGMLSGAALTVKAHTATTNISPGAETPLEKAKGAGELTPHGLKFGLTKYMPPSISRASANHPGAVVSIVYSFTALENRPRSTSGVVDLDDDGVEINLPPVTRTEITRVRNDDVFFEMLGQPVNALEIWSTLGIDPTTQAFLNKFDPRVHAVVGDFPGGVIQSAFSFQVEFKLFEHMIMNCGVNIIDSKDFDTREAFLRAAHAFEEYMSLYGDTSGLPADIRRHIKFTPIRQAAMAYAVRRSAGAPTTAEQEEAFVYRIRRDEEEEATPLFGLNVPEDDVERVANILDRVVMVHVPTQRVGNVTYTVPQLRLPERLIAPFTQPIAPIQADEINLTVGDLRANGKHHASKRLNFTSENELVLAGELTAGHTAQFINEDGDFHLGPYWDSTQWRESVTGGEEATLIIVKHGYVNINPGSVLKGKNIIIQCWARLCMSPTVDITWHRRYESCGLFNWGTKTINEQKIKYTDIIVLENSNANLTLESTENEVVLAGVHLKTRDKKDHTGSVAVFAGKDIELDALITKLRSSSVSNWILDYAWSSSNIDEVRSTRFSTIPNLITLEKVLKNPKIMEALLAQMLGIATEDHLNTLETNSDFAALKQSTITLRANGKIKGKAAELAAAFIELAAGNSIELNEAMQESSIGNSGFVLDFGTLGNAVMNLIDSVCTLCANLTKSKEITSETQFSLAQAKIHENLPVLFPMMREVMKFSLINSALKISEKMSEAECISMCKAIERLESPEYKEYKSSKAPTTDEDESGPWELFGKDVWKSVEGIVRPIAAASTANLTEVAGAFARVVKKARETDKQNANQMTRIPAHKYQVGEVVEDSLNFIFQSIKVGLMLEHINKEGWKKFIEKMNPFSQDNIEQGIGIGITIYSEYITRKTPVKGSVQALFGLKMKAPQLLIQGTEMRGLVADWDSEEIKVGAVAHHEDRFHASAGASVNMKSHVSVHGEWSTDKKVTFEPVSYRFQVLRIPHARVLYMFGGYIVADFGMGQIDKLVYVNQADTHAQDGFNAGITIDAKAIAETCAGNAGAALAIVKDVTIGGRSGSMQVVRGGKAVFSAPGIKVHDVEEITPEEYDTRVSRTTTVSNPVTLEGEASTYGDFLSTRSMYGERESGFSIPNAALGSNLDNANEQSRKIQKQRADRLARDKAEHEARTFVDPTDITDYTAATV